MDNPYQAPESRIEAVAQAEPELASLGSRFGAAFIDGLIMLAVLMPLEFAGGFLQLAFNAGATRQAIPLGTTFMWSLIGVLVFVLIQGYPLVKDGQTWGKKVCSIKIVSIEGGQPPVPQLAIRYAVYMLPGAIPLIGGLASLVNICLIFRSDRRCGHDLAAGTRVICA